MEFISKAIFANVMNVVEQDCVKGREKDAVVIKM